MLNRRNILKFSALVTISTLFIGCGASNFHRVSPNYEQSMKSNNNFLLVVDNCIKSDYTGDDSDNWTVYKSEKANQVLIEAVKEDLKKKNYMINQTLTPSMCGYFGKDTKDTKIQVTPESDLIIGDLPYQLDNNLDQDLNAAIARVKKAAYVAGRKMKGFNEYFKKQPGIVEDLQLIKKHTGQDKVLFFNNIAIDVSAGKSFGEALATGILTLGIYSRYSVNSLVTVGTLVDLDKQEILWRTAVKLKKPDLYEKDWYLDNYKSTILDSI